MQQNQPVLHYKVLKHKIPSKKEHRNLLKDISNPQQKKSHFFVEPQMALSSTNFNKNHSNSLMQINHHTKAYPNIDEQSLYAGVNRPYQLPVQ